MGTEWAATDQGRAVGDFVGAHGQSLLRFAFLLTGGRGAQAEDLVQAVLARLVERGLDGLDNPLAYTRRAIVNEQRSAARRAAAEDRRLRHVAGADVADGPVTVDRQTMFTALKTLNERERAVIVLRYYVDLPDTEIGDIVGCSRATVRSLVHRALPKLKARLGETYRPPGPAAGPARAPQQREEQP
jgi:RNA polymerase sigma factor (sigma-70 family)